MKLATLCLLLLVAPACSRISPEERRAVDAYTETVAPLAREGGRIVVQEIRPSLGDLSSGRIDAAEFGRRASAWKAAMQKVRTGFANAPRTPGLEQTAKIFDISFNLYLEAIDAFVIASSKTGEALTAAISAAVPTAERADTTYDQAVALLKKERKRVGLPEVSVP